MLTKKKLATAAIASTLFFATLTPLAAQNVEASDLKQTFLTEEGQVGTEIQYEDGILTGKRFLKKFSLLSACAMWLTMKQSICRQLRVQELRLAIQQRSLIKVQGPIKYHVL
ncbi:hypothetical protein HB820_08260 [Listeria booriae]|uniref:hypothetical protein n=1 Tax=Listeria booriae TaxID=1552123 RepID=UPI00162843E9|nr:hypothetical protein [Listeria booriae]MBC1335293.1 hypothetical protein [Listeria booriae]